jgi:hypothetical protein
VIPKQSAIGLLFILSGVPVYFYYKKRKKITEITAKITEVTTFEKE